MLRQHHKPLWLHRWLTFSTVPSSTSFAQKNWSSSLLLMTVAGIVSPLFALTNSPAASTYYKGEVFGVCAASKVWDQYIVGSLGDRRYWGCNLFIFFFFIRFPPYSGAQSPNLFILVFFFYLFCIMRHWGGAITWSLKEVSLNLVLCFTPPLNKVSTSEIMIFCCKKNLFFLPVQAQHNVLFFYFVGAGCNVLSWMSFRISFLYFLNSMYLKVLIILAQGSRDWSCQLQDHIRFLLILDICRCSTDVSYLCNNEILMKCQSCRFW